MPFPDSGPQQSHIPGAAGTERRENGSAVFNPNTQATMGAGNDISTFLQGLFQNPQAFMQGLQGMANPLQQQAVGNMGSFLNQPAPETRALGQAQPAINSLLSGNEVQNPFGNGPFGGFSAGQQVVNAAQPVFQQNLQQAMTGAANRAPSLRNSAFGDEAGGLAQRALGDFNLFQQQALQQGQQLDLQHQGMGQNFALGARGLAQQGQNSGLGMLGMLSQAAGQNPFGRMMGAGQLGNQIGMGNINALISLMQGGMQFGRQSPMELMVPQRQADPNALDWVNAGAGVLNAVGEIIPG